MKKTDFQIFALFWTFICLINSGTIQAQNEFEQEAAQTIIPVKDKLKLSFFEPAPQFHFKRTLWSNTAAFTAYTGGMIAVSQLWYKNYEQSPFHFFNDGKGWLQIDKIGHSWTAYSESYYGVQVYRWCGMKDKYAIWIGGSLGTVLQMGIEVLDGFSAEWGASPGDIFANISGSALVIAQELAWKEQRVRLKFSSHQVNYGDYDDVVQQRVKSLYGDNYGQRMLKDYNGQSYWLSVNPASFMKNENHRFPKWLNIAFGYGASGMLGAEQNIWKNKETGEEFDYSNIRRYRQYYLSLDVDLSRIKTKSRFLKFVLGSFNILKVPAPALEFNTKGEVKFHYLHW